MPKVFADDTAGRAERYAVVRYLSTLGTSLKSARGPAKDWDKSVERGRARSSRPAGRVPPGADARTG